MSTPARGRGGPTVTRGTGPAPRGRGLQRGSSTPRGRGRGRGGSATPSAPTNNAGGLLQQLRTGAIVRRPSDEGTTTSSRGRGAGARGQPNAPTRGRGSVSRTFNRAQSPRPTSSAPVTSPAPNPSHRDFMTQMNEKFQSLKPKRDAERKRAIQDGFLADPEKKTSLANAITPVGTCTEMCPEFERVERIVQNMVDRTEKVSNEASGRDMPSEDRMVKRFRRSAAGYDEQLPSDIRTPETLRRTLDYLIDSVIGGGERLASIHKFVWDRTRGIRNDFSIQQVSKKEDVKIAVECYERIARFHILSLHQLSNPDNLQEGEHFDAHQEREQLNNTLLSLMYYYDDNRGAIPLPNEPEFRSYCILFELQTLTPDLEDRMQAWPVELLNHPKVQTAFKLYAAAGNTIMDQGPLRPSTPFSVAQSNAGKFWTLMSSKAVSYIMACVAEMHFSIVRFAALDALWRSAKSSPQGQQARNQDWTLSELQNYLAFDDEDETMEFCQAFDLAFKNSDSGERCLDFTAVGTNVLDKSSIPSQQIFSRGIVEDKRYRRTLVAIVNGVGIAIAIRQGLVVESNDGGNGEQQQDTSVDEQSLFIPETAATTTRRTSTSFGSSLNPSAITFTPSSSFGQSNRTQSNQDSPGHSVFGQKPSFQFGTPVSPYTASSFTNHQSSTAPFSENGIFSQPMSTPQRLVSPAPDSGILNTPKEPLFQGFAEANNSRSTSPYAQDKKNAASTTPSNFNQNAQTTISTASNAFGGAGFGFTNTAQQSLPASKLFAQNTYNEVSNPVPTASTSVTGSVLGPNWASQSSAVQQTPQVQTSSVAPLNGFTFKQPEAPKFESATQRSTITPQPVVTTSSFPAFSIARDPDAPQPPPAPVSESVKKPATSPFPSVLNDNSNPSFAPVPTFSFAQPSQKSEPKPFESPLAPSTLPSLEPFTTPQGTPKRPQLSNYKFPTVTESKDSVDKSVVASADIQAPQPDPTPISSQHAKSEVLQTQLSLLPRQPEKPRFTQADRNKLIENTSRLILTQPQGLIEYFVSHHVSNLIQTVFKKHLQDQQDEVMAYVRTRHLSRKFFIIWREKTQRIILTKRAKQRRKLLTAAMQAEQIKKQRDEAELEAILYATQETKRLQEEQMKMREQTKIPSEQDPRAETQASQLAGQKRKTTSANDSLRSRSSNSQQSWSSHKRSRTVGTMSEPSASMRLSTSSNIFRTSVSNSGTSRFGQSLMNRSTSSADLRRPITQKVDSTKTDYFKLKAMGIDPNTPLIPDTAKSLEARKVKDLEAKQALLAKSKTRPSMFATSVSSRQSSPMPPPSKPIPTMVNSSPLRSTTSTAIPSSSEFSSKEDPFLRQLREARQSLAKDTDWFKRQSAVLEKEIESQEATVRNVKSQMNNQNEHSQVQLDHGFANVNGYDYRPSEAKQGKTLSRTEERIRRTGAHGLATRPTSREYVPVAMSRQSALRYSQGAQHEVTLSGKKRPGEGRVGIVNEDKPSIDHSSPVTKRLKEDIPYNKSRANLSPVAKASLNAFAALQNDDDLEDEEEDENELEEEEDEEDNSNNYFYHNGADGDTEDNDDNINEDEEEDDDLVEEDDSEEEDVEDQNHPAQYYAVLANMPGEEHVYDDDEEEEEDEGDEDDDGTPGTYPHFSRAQSGSSTGMQSGPGASADDALVLSD